MSLFDLYSLRARILPALVVVLPLGLLMFTLLPGHPFFVSAFLGVLGTIGGTGVLAQLGRDLGRKKEPNLWKSWDGPPTTRLLRHRRELGDITLVPGLREQVEKWVGDPLPTKEEEETCPSQADTRYEQVVMSLREATRDRIKFPLVFAENVNYGFRRNLWGLRAVGACIAVMTVLVSWVSFSLTIWGRPWPDPWWDVFVNPDSTAMIRLVVATADTIIAAFWVFHVKPAWVKVAANAYAIRLMESVYTLRG